MTEWRRVRILPCCSINPWRCPAPPKACASTTNLPSHCSHHLPSQSPPPAYRDFLLRPGVLLKFPVLWSLTKAGFNSNKKSKTGNESLVELKESNILSKTFAETCISGQVFYKWDWCHLEEGFPLRKMKLSEKKASLGGLAGKQMRFPRETEITSVIAIYMDVLIACESWTLKMCRSGGIHAPAFNSIFHPHETHGKRCGRWGNTKSEMPQSPSTPLQGERNN